MSYSEFLGMGAELSLMAVIILLFIYDTFTSSKVGKYLPITAILLLGIQTLYLAFGNSLGLGGLNDDTSLFGGMYVSTNISNVAKIILNIGTILVFTQAASWVKEDDMKIRRGEYYVLTLITLLGMYFMMSAQNFLLFFIGLETASLPMTALVAIEKYKENSYEAAAKYLFFAVFSSALMLLGLSYIYGATGTLYYTGIASELTVTPLTIVAIVLFLAGMGFKLSLVPFHLWTADVYQGAPTVVTSYLSVISKGAAAYALMVALTTAFGSGSEVWFNVLYIVIALTITIGNLFAIRQQNIKRFLAFSSVSQAGYIMLGVMSYENGFGDASLLYYVLVYIFSNIAAFAVAGAIERASGKLNINDYDGLYKTNPKLSVAMMLAMFSLAGIPPFAGFFSKFFIFYSAIETGTIPMYVLVFIALLNTIISLYYYLLVVKAMFLKDNETPIATIKSDGYTKAVVFVTALGIILLGLVSCVYDYIYNAAI
ncbi:MAG: NADH-quinone oxidoreductase subunit N [Bacteroidales bacterium]|nr:NADH-quinone oxidoreductase subunit N [Bacteroidales bacterium]